VQSVGKEAFRSLDKFTLKGCPLNALDIKELLVPMLASTKFLKLLNLEKNQLADAPVQQLCASGMLHRVETLNLRFNRIGDKGATAIAQCKAFATMKWVNLKVNNVSDTGALALAAALRHNSSMTLLNLRKQFPALTDKSAKGFAEMLQTNSTLQQLRLRRNKISDAGAEMLATAAAQRIPRLCREIPLWEEVRFELDLEENRIGDAGALALLCTASTAPSRARVEILLSGNAVTRDSLCLAVAEAGEGLDASDPRIIFTSKPEYDL
jgi:Ran GTPase-activating protein (RanGAP) involved in mRNA processing and transport